MRSNCICFQFINLMYSDNNGACYCIIIIYYLFFLCFLFRTSDFCILGYNWRIWNFNISKYHEMSTIWSSSKSTLNSLQTNGCKQIMRYSTKMGWNACMPNPGTEGHLDRGGQWPPLIFPKKKIINKYTGTNFNNLVL